MKRLDERGNASNAARSGRAAAGDLWQPRGGKVSACAIASLVPRITRKSFEKHGFAAASLIMDWALIVGRERAADTRPLKLKWPRAVEKFGATADGCEGRPEATLVLQVDPAIALDIQYQSAQIIERINAYFGYRAVASLKLVQEAVEQRIPARPTVQGRDQISTSTTGGKHKPPGIPQNSQSGDDSDPLSAALERLGAHVSAHSQRRKPENCR